MPLEGLNKSPERRAVLLDITCDSDGAIDHYVDGDGIATTMPMPEYDPENPPMLGFFMVGAYQEILGNMHNLFGDTEAVDVFVFPDGSVEVELSDEGDTVADMLQYVQLDPNTLLTQFRDQVKNTGLDDALQQQFLEEFGGGTVRLYLSGRRVAADARWRCADRACVCRPDKAKPSSGSMRYSLEPVCITGDNSRQ